jgi:hypothetical protein
MQIRNLRMGITRPSPPTLAEIEQQREDLLTQADLSSRRPNPKNTPRRKPGAHRAHILVISRTGFPATQRRTRPRVRPPNPKNPPRRKPRAHRAHFLAISRTRISCHAALDEAARAPFSKERRMKFAKATKFHRKSGEPRISCHAALDEAAHAPFSKDHLPTLAG